jgi:SAM-dependent methyltransferase
MQIYITDKQALAFYKQQASPDYWDQHWKIEDLQALIRGTTDDNLFIPAVKRHLPSKSTVLEGGCGRGQLVHALQYQGYKALGLDFASETIKNIKQAVPELDVRLGDVRALELPDASLDGYISVGVIEHFWEGYGVIIKEMYRTLKVGGFLFVSFPYLSPLRRLKIALQMYPFKESNLLNDQQGQFYQFALNAGIVQADLESLGFQLKERFTYDGIKGFKDEVTLFKPYLQQIYDGKSGRRWRSLLNRFFLSFASHCALLVMQKME